MPRRIVALLIFILCASTAIAQSDSTVFKVVSFRKLDWDLDARSNYPMMDQNGHKAALIKVVIPNDNFDFDVGIMGIVGVRQEIGEIWVYVPEGVRKMTIRHKDYGIIRDYQFGIPIESATVYELLLEVHRPPESKVVVRDSIVYLPSPVKQEIPYRRKVIGAAAIVTAAAPDLSAGLMLTCCPDRIGGYLKYRSNFTASVHDYMCSPDGTTGSGYVWTSGESRVSRLAVSAGAVLRCTGWLYACAGAGYGRRVLIWKDSEGRRVKVDGHSPTGFASDLGAVFKLGPVALYAGASTINFRYFDMEVGLGFNF